MRLIYPYNEILPKKSAHDVYIVRNCTSLATEGCTVELVCGAGSLSPDCLAKHYNIHPVGRFSWKTLPIIRKNLGIPLTWDKLFFWGTQRYISKSSPDWVALSVFKQGAYHLKRRHPGTKYLYEVHELAWYPGRDVYEPKLRKRLALERELLSRADAVTVTTDALHDILRGWPYELTVPIAIIPLAVDFTPLPPPPPFTGELQLMYVGQMYQGQGVNLLLQALTQTEGIRLTLVGGKLNELNELRQLAQTLGIESRVNFTGFLPPTELPEIVANSHVLIAPFSATGRMAYVAHTKLLEYAAWQRPIVAPDLPVVREHFSREKGWVPFIADNVDSLAAALRSLSEDELRQNLTTACLQQGVLTWKERSSRLLEFLYAL